MKRVTCLYSSFLYFDTPTQLLHVCGLVIIKPDSMPGGYSFRSFRDEVERRVLSVAEFRQKLRLVPFGIDHPAWVDDENFDIDRQLHRIALPSPGEDAELADLCGHLAGVPLDRTRPLWEMWVIEGLADGRIAVFTKMHHATVDGMSGMSLLSHLCSLEPEMPEPDPKQPERTHQELQAPGGAELLARAFVRNAQRPMRVARLLSPTINALVGSANRARSGTAMAAPLTAPRTSFNGTISGRRSVAFTDLSLDDIKTVKNATSGTVNDVILTVASGALRRYLEGRDELPKSSLLATVPVSVRETSDKPGSNQVSALFTRLRTDIADPSERLKAVAEGNSKAKDHQKAIPADALQEWAELSAPKTFGVAVRIYSGLRLAEKHPVVHNLVISNVPGPPMPLYLLGARITGFYPLGPVFHGAGLNVTVLSNAGKVHVGLLGARELVKDLWPLADALPEALAELVKAAG